MQPQPNGLYFPQGNQGEVNGANNSNYYQQPPTFAPWPNQSAGARPEDFFYNGGDANHMNPIRQQQQQQQQHYQHPYQYPQQQMQAQPPKVASATPYFSRPASCASPKAFRTGSDRNSFQSSPSHFVSGTQSPKPTAAHPFIQMPVATTVPLMNPAAPVFHDYSPKGQQLPLQGTSWHQRTSSTGPPPTPPPTSYSPTQPGFFGNLLQTLALRNMMTAFNNESGVDTSQGQVPLHQQRFGYPEDDLPLLDELGIFPHEIRANALAVLNPFREMGENVSDSMDLAGPIVFAVLLAILLSLRGSMRFGTIYGQFVIGVIFMRVLLSLMTENAVSLQFVISALGYGLIPNVFLAASQSLMYWLFGYVGKTMLVPALLAVLWSAWCATSMLVRGFHMEKQRYLIMYPLSLFYAVFATLTIF